MLADQGIRAGDIDIAVAGGMESMSNCAVSADARPRRSAHGQRRGRRLDDQRRPLVRVRAGATWATPARSWPSTIASAAPRRTSTPRRAIRRRRARTAQAASRKRSCRSRFRRRRATAVVVDRDESIRADTTVGRAGALKPAFKKDGTVTAGNAPGVNDGASALVVMAAERASRSASRRWLASSRQATSGLAPKFVLMTPVEAVRRVARKGRLGSEGRRSLRAQRGLRGPGGRGAQRARHRSATASTSTAAPSRSATRSDRAAAACSPTLVYALKRRNLKRGIATPAWVAGTASR